MADEAWTEHYYGGQEPGQQPHITCHETTTQRDLAAGKRTYICGQECPKPAGPDPARDARIDAYRDRERRRAARALDRYIEALQTGDVAVSAVAGDHVVELIGDYILARLGDTGLNVQQKSNYGVPLAECPNDGFTCPDHPGVTHHNAETNPYEGKSIKELGEIMSSDDYRNPPQLCSCPAMEQPHIRGRFTLCPPAGEPDGSGRLA